MPMNTDRSARKSRTIAVCLLALLGAPLTASLAMSTSAHAQAVVASVNDDPITNVDIDQHARILRAMKRPATHEAALEDVIETRLKLIETSKFKIAPGNSEIGWAIGITARAIKMDPQAFLAGLQRAGVTQDQWQQKWKAEAAWMMYVRALNRSLEVSENEVRSELAREGKSRGTEYTVRQIVMVVPASAGAAGVQAKLAQAQSLRARFTDCDSGLQLARGLTDTAVKEQMTRSASTLSPELRKVLDDTPVGRLTPASRGASGVEMLAVCKKVEREDSAAAENLRNDLLAKKLEGQSQSRYREVRAKAIVVKK
jgi:peptidyl-prolyl cis-trans isomerase SurA